MIELDDFETDVQQAEVSINETNIRTKKTTKTKNGNSNGEGGSDGNAASTFKAGLFANISNDQYHKSTGISSTQLKPAVKSMHLYKETMDGKIPFEQTESMKLGTAVHKIILEAMDFPNEIAISRKFGRKKEDQIEKQEFILANEGKIVITADQYDKCRYMRDSVMRLPEIESIFATGKPELSGYYLDKAPDRSESTYMACKYRPDWRTDWCIADIKTTVDASAESFSKTINNLHYHLSADHYLEGDRILKGTDHRQFIFICVEPNPPYHAAMYRLGSESLELGHELRRSILGKIKKCRESNEWPILNDGICQEIEVPSYALNKLRELKV